jgi:hypothetical protein
MVVGWEFEEEFTKENVDELLENHIGAAVNTYRRYIDELTKASEKN